MVLGLSMEQVERDHDLLQRLVVGVEGMAKDMAEVKTDIKEMTGKLGESQQSITMMQAGLTDRPREMQQHQEMYGFYSTFKNFLWPLLLSGPVSAIVAAFITYLLTHNGG